MCKKCSLIERSEIMDGTEPVGRHPYADKQLWEPLTARDSVRRQGVAALQANHMRYLGINDETVLSKQILSAGSRRAQ